MKVWNENNENVNNESESCQWKSMKEILMKIIEENQSKKESNEMIMYRKSMKIWNEICQWRNEESWLKIKPSKAISYGES
jgi:hypothetical protein